MRLPIVAALAWVFGTDQSPREKRSSIVIESGPIHRHFRAINSLTLSPVQTAVKIIVA